jgi:hypothetical protein
LSIKVAAFADKPKVDGASTGPAITGKIDKSRTFVSVLAMRDGFSQFSTLRNCGAPNTVKDFRE